MNTIPVPLSGVILSTDVANACVQTEGDCACPTWHSERASIGQTVMMPTEKTLFQVPVELLSLDDEHSILFSAVQPCQLAVIDANALAVWHYFQTPRRASEALASTELSLPTKLTLQIIKKLWQGNFLTLTPTLPSVMEGEDELIAWLHITDRCNLRCTYCYLSHVRADMLAVTGIAAIEAIFRSALIHGYQRIKLKYAGGEPLLRFDLITHLQKHAQALAAREGVTLKSLVISNGTLLTKEIVNVLRELDISLVISLDGQGHLHDYQRIYANGQGTFDQVMAGITLACKLHLLPHISITITEHSVQGLTGLIKWLLEQRLPFSINFYRAHDLSVTHPDLHVAEQAIIEGMLAAFKVIQNNLPPSSLLHGLVDRANLCLPHRYPCGVGHNYMVFDSEGRVAKCQMQMGHTVTTVDAHDPLAVLQRTQLGVLNLPAEEKQGCKSCQWKYFCTGGCPLSTHRATGRYNVQSPNCNIYKALLPEVVRLEGWRLLKSCFQ